MGALRVLSFHSVKGGVGKSTLSTLAALVAARAHPEADVWLIDMDLTGTSLADALPLMAPYRGTIEEPSLGDLRAPPDGHLDVDLSRELIEQRGLDQVHPGPIVSVPFLNDWLLFADPSWDPAADARVDAVAWRLEAGPRNLRVLPSSALPVDLAWILPVIFDEEHAAFLEGRLELMLAALVSPDRDVWVIFDVPPTIPGLSRALLGLALRLGHPGREPVPLSRQDPWIPPELLDPRPRWLACLVATPDHQDLRAASRWVAEIAVADEPVFQIVVNRAESEAVGNREALARGLKDPVTLDAALWRDCLFIPDSPGLRLFRGDSLEHLPSSPIGDLLERLL